MNEDNKCEGKKEANTTYTQKLGKNEDTNGRDDNKMTLINHTVIDLFEFAKYRRFWVGESSKNKLESNIPKLVEMTNVKKKEIQ